jgi:hypothetical protein
MPATLIAGAGRTAPSLSPELVLVSPDLRERALALLPDRSPDGWIPPPYAPPPLALVRVPVVPDDLPPEHERPLSVRAALYAFESATQAAVLGGGLVAVTATLAMLADLLHS